MKGHYVGTLIDLLCELGVDRQDFLRRCRLDESELTSETLIDQDRVSLATELAARVSGDPAIGLAAGQRLNINTHGPLGYAAMASEDLEHALHLLVRYYKVQTPRAHFELHRQGGRLAVVCEPSFQIEAMPWLTSEFLVSSIYTSTEFLLRGSLQGCEICFRFAEPDHSPKYLQFFRAPCRFQQTFTGFLIPLTLAQQPLMSADAVAASLFEKRCEDLRKEIEGGLLSERIRELQIRRMGQFLSQAEVARRLNLSVSTLHRKLADEGHSYKALLAEIKKDAALEHLRNGAMTIDQIAHLLGFSDASNFRRAFIAWTGVTPSQFRQGEDP